MMYLIGKSSYVIFRKTKSDKVVFASIVFEGGMTFNGIKLIQSEKGDYCFFNEIPKLNINKKTGVKTVVTPKKDEKVYYSYGFSQWDKESKQPVLNEWGNLVPWTAMDRTLKNDILKALKKFLAEPEAKLTGTKVEAAY